MPRLRALDAAYGSAELARRIRQFDGCQVVSGAMVSGWCQTGRMCSRYALQVTRAIAQIEANARVNEGD